MELAPTKLLARLGWILPSEALYGAGSRRHPVILPDTSGVASAPSSLPHLPHLPSLPPSVPAVRSRILYCQPSLPFPPFSLGLHWSLALSATATPGPQRPGSSTQALSQSAP